MLEVYEVADSAFVIGVPNEVFVTFAIFSILLVSGKEILALLQIARTALQLEELFGSAARFGPLGLDAVGLGIIDGVEGGPEAMVGLLRVVEQGGVIFLQLGLGGVLDKILSLHLFKCKLFYGKSIFRKGYNLRFKNYVENIK